MSSTPLFTYGNCCGYLDSVFKNQGQGTTNMPQMKRSTDLKKSFQVGTLLSTERFRDRLRRRGNIWFVTDNRQRLGKERQPSSCNDKQQECVYQRLRCKEQAIFRLCFFKKKEAEELREVRRQTSETLAQSAAVC